MLILVICVFLVLLNVARGLRQDQRYMLDRVIHGVHQTMLFLNVQEHYLTPDDEPDMMGENERGTNVA